MAEPTTPEKQCRICLDGEDLALGRLIRPCLCKGSMSVNTSVHDSSNPSQLLIYRQFVHVGCLKRWRDSSPSKNFFSCPVCHYQYRLGRTRVVGIATNPGNYISWPPRVYLTYQPLVVVGAVSSVLFTILVLLSSHITTYFMGALEEPSSYIYSYYISPWSVGRDLVRTALRILKEESGLELDDDAFGPTTDAPSNPPGALRMFLKRFSWFLSIDP